MDKEQIKKAFTAVATIAYDKAVFHCNQKPSPLDQEAKAQYIEDAVTHGLQIFHHLEQIETLNGKAGI